MDRGAGLGIALPPKLEEGGDGIREGGIRAGGAGDFPEGIALFLQQAGHGGELHGGGKHVPEIVQIRGLGMLIKKEDALIPGPPQSVRIRPGEVEGFHEVIVLQKAHKDGGQHPADGNLGEFLLPPGLVGEGGALAGLRLGVSFLQRAIGSGEAVALGPEGILETGDLGLEVFEQGRGTDHEREADAGKRSRRERRFLHFNGIVRNSFFSAEMWRGSRV